MRAVPVPFSSADQERAVVSAAPSPFGEKMDGPTSGATAGPAVSTVTTQVRTAGLPASSYPASATV